jgi:hypothetical protein
MIAVVLAAVTGSLVAAPAGATTATANVFFAGGVVYPGVPTLGTVDNTWQFNVYGGATTGVVAGRVTPLVSPTNCDVIVYSSDSIGLGQGTGSWSCTAGIYAGRSGSVTYLRAGSLSIYQFSGGLTIAAACLFPGADQYHGYELRCVAPAYSSV